MTDADIFKLPSRLCVSIRMTEGQTKLIERAAAAAGVSPGQWAQRHMLAALGCLEPNSPEDVGVLTDIYANASYLDSLLVEKQ
ncbi:MAG: hypothetical protein JWR51_3861 [Devosia sp.]|uniref:hypothetical protein n=1 Tax=Devosia sp. TaxID=1871048 RepID=UPI002611220B|nr:hypothetical protein [Devosia sp.]MDB5530758.1 hypothetical protein [Devosia sp.]